MRRYFVSAPVIILTVLGHGVGQDAAKKEMNRLEGKYKQVSVKVGDAQLPENLVAQLRLEIKGNLYESPSVSKGPIIKLRFKIDPSKNPKQIDFTIETDGAKEMGVMKCIYELSGDTLRIARPYGTDPDKVDFGDRPKDFDSAQYIEVWERIKDR